MWGKTLIKFFSEIKDSVAFPVIDFAFNL